MFLEIGRDMKLGFGFKETSKAIMKLSNMLCFSTALVLLNVSLLLFVLLFGAVGSTLGKILWRWDKTVNLMRCLRRYSTNYRACLGLGLQNFL